MQVIQVPAPPKSAFNKNRRPSDLLVGQLRHFQHVEHKQGIEIDRALSRDIHTEAGAARYITQMTKAIRAQSSGGLGAAPVAVSSKPKRNRSAAPGLSLAAAGHNSTVAAVSKAKKASNKKAKSSKRKRP